MDILRYGRAASLKSLVLPACFYLCLSAIITMAVWPYAPPPSDALIGLSLFALWRYGWQLTHFVRAFLYANYYYPKLRRRADALAAEQAFPAHIYFVIPSYKEDAWVSIECIHSILSNMTDIPSTATLVIPTGQDEDDAVIARAVESHPANTQVNVVLQRQKDGKRIAMGHALRAVARRYRDEPNSVTIFMDGDSYLETGTLKKLLPLFAVKPNLGAVTTNETAFVDTQSALYKDWFNLKFGQRHILFQSHSLSNKVLTLTGRFSVFRTGTVVTEEFISRMEVDNISHARHGKFRFLMGDDKSSWFSLLKDKWHMLYLPDVLVYSLESRDADFFQVSQSLPFRWYGNTLRNNARALALGWRTTGLFIWVAILDQRLSMWTSLVGLVGALVLSIMQSPVFLPLYIAWVLLVRTIQMAVIAAAGHRVTFTTIPLMLYGQWYGAIVKIRAFYNLNDQNWSKGAAKNKIQTQIITPRSRLITVVPKLSQAMAYCMFISFILFGHKVIKLPQLSVIAATGHTGGLTVDAVAYGIVANDGRPDSDKLNALLGWLAEYPGSVIKLPAGEILVDKPIMISAGDIAITGAGPTKTRLVSTISGQGAVLQVKGEKYDHHHALDIQPNGDVRAEPGVFSRQQWILLNTPNTDTFLTHIGSQVWRQEYPYIRQQLLPIKGQKAQGELMLQGELLWPIEEMTHARQLKVVENVLISDLSIQQLDSVNVHAQPPSEYENRHYELAVDGIAAYMAANLRIENVTVHNAGRHPINWEYCFQCIADDLTVDGAWNKGPGGYGYIRFNKTFESCIKNARIYNIRHIVFQWSSANNCLKNIDTNVDVNFHGGMSQYNTAQNIRFNLPVSHPWPEVYVTPNDAHWAPPDGRGNSVNGTEYSNQR